MSFIQLPPPGSAFWRDGVATSASLPTAGSVVGECRIAQDTGYIYYWSGSAWVAVPTSGAVLTSRTISTTAPLTGGGDLSANRTFAITQSATAADGYLSSTDWNTFNNKVAATRTISTTAPLTGGGDLSANRTLAMPVATSIADGYLSAANWTTFNNKEPAISSAATTTYWRGDKTFVTLNMAAITSVTDGSAAGAGVVGQIITASQASNTTSNVGSTGTWGYAISASITAGRWLVWGTVGFNANGAVLTTSQSAGISSSTTASGIDEFDTVVAPFEVSGANDALLTTPYAVVNISGTTTYYLNTRFFYTSGTPRHRGKISALRIG